MGAAALAAAPRIEETQSVKAISHKCPECDGQKLFTATTSSGGQHGPALLPGLGGFLHYAKFRVVVCQTCGLTRFYAEPEALEKLPAASQWQRM